MDVLSDILEPHADLIAKFAGIVTSLQFISGIFLLNDIRRKGSSDAFPDGPFLGGVVLTCLSLKYGAILRDTAMIRVNFFGFILNVIFLAIFYWYGSTAKRAEIWTHLGVSGLFTAACITYARYENPDLVEFRFGMIITGILVALVGMPFLSLPDIIRKKSTEGLPFPIILAGSIVSASWMLYGIAIRHNTICFQNAFLFTLCLIQLSLFVIYPNKPVIKKSKNKKKVTADDSKKDK